MVPPPPGTAQDTGLRRQCQEGSGSPARAHPCVGCVWGRRCSCPALPRPSPGPPALSLQQPSNIPGVPRGQFGNKAAVGRDSQRRQPAMGSRGAVLPCGGRPAPGLQYPQTPPEGNLHARQNRLFGASWALPAAPTRRLGAEPLFTKARGRRRAREAWHRAGASRGLEGAGGTSAWGPCPCSCHREVWVGPWAESWGSPRSCQGAQTCQVLSLCHGCVLGSRKRGRGGGCCCTAKVKVAARERAKAVWCWHRTVARELLGAASEHRVGSLSRA